jgi:hypothetical protein
VAWQSGLSPRYLAPGFDLVVKSLEERLLCDIVDLIAVMVCEDYLVRRTIIRIVAFFRTGIPERGREVCN